MIEKEMCGPLSSKNWENLPLKRLLISARRGVTPNYVEEDGVIVIGQAAIQSSGLSWSKARLHQPSRQFPVLRGQLLRGDILVNSTGTGTLGRVGLFEGGPSDVACVADGHVTILRVNEARITPRFLFHLLRSSRFNLYASQVMATGATNQIELAPSGLLSLRVPVPDIPTQQSIVEVLDRDMASTRAVLDQLDTELTLLDEWRNALVESIIDVGRYDSMKLFWGLQLLRDGSHQPPPRVECGVAILTARNISTGALRTTPYDTFVSDADARDMEQSLKPRAGDVLVSVKGTIGAVCVYPEGAPRAVLDRNIALLRTAKALDPDWLSWVLKSQSVRDQIRMCVTSAAQPGLPLGDIRNLRIPAVPEFDQRSQLAEIRRADSVISELENQVRKQKVLMLEREEASNFELLAGVRVDSLRGDGK